MQLYAELESKDEFATGGRNGHSDNPEGRTRSKKVEAIIPETDFEAVHSALKDSGFEISVSDVRTSRAGALRRQFYRGATYEVLIPKLKLELLVPAERLSEALDVLTTVTEEQAAGGRTVLVYDVDSALHVVHPAAGGTRSRPRRSL